MERPKRKKNPNSRKNLIKPAQKVDNSIFALLERIPDEKTCREWFEKIRLELNIGCPYCGHEKYTTFIIKKTGNKKYNCCKCKKQYALTQGTVFENTKLPFRKWIIAMYINANSSKGISSYQAARILGVTQKTAWLMMQKVRKMYKNYISGVQLEGTVEVDETYLGTRQPVENGKKKPTGYATKRGSIFGMLQRDGEIYVEAIPNTDAKTLEGIIDSVIIDPTKTTIMSDQLSGYDNLKNKYKHGRVVHRREWAKPGGITTNNIEAFWSLLKKSEYGVYHSRYGNKHIDLYAAEIAYLSSKRNAQSEDRISDLMRLCLGNLSWKDLRDKKPVKFFPTKK
jgi:transposase-like protein